jgi:hypothetical protein
MVLIIWLFQISKRITSKTTISNKADFITPEKYMAVCGVVKVKLG